jgi:hypothetical protein
MGIKRYFADADTTISNAYKSDFRTRATGSNMGQSDILEVFSFYGQATTTSSELSRALIQFPVSDISTDRSSGAIPASGSVSFYLRMFNAKHSQTLPRNFVLEVSAAASGWEEGNGLDLDDYSDLTYDEVGASWIKRSAGTSWTNAGGDFHTLYDSYNDLSSSFSQTFSIGDEDLEIDVTPLVEQWINSAGNILGSKTNNGFGIKFKTSHESETKSYYTKKFFARSSEFFFERPVLEARYENRTLDDRGNFYFSSSLASATDNLNTIYLYNYVRGRLSNIPSLGATEPIYVSIFSGSSDDSEPADSALRLSLDNDSNVVSSNQYVVTGGYVSTGVYSASFAFTGSSTLETIYDVWFSGGNSIADATSATIQFHTGTISPKTLTAQGHNQYTRYVLSMPSLKTEYYNNQTERFRIYARQKDWSPTIYTKAIATPETLVFESASYEIFRATDDKIVVAYGTGSDNYSLLSYDVSGNYFDLDMSMLDPGYSYGIRYSIYEDSVQSYTEQPYIFKFRVNKYDY